MRPLVRMAEKFPPVDWWTTRRWFRRLLEQGTRWPEPLTWRDLRTVRRVHKRQVFDTDHAFADDGREQREVWLLRIDLTLRFGRQMVLWEVDRYAQVKFSGSPISYETTVDEMAFYAFSKEAHAAFREAVAWAEQIMPARAG